MHLVGEIQLVERDRLEVVGHSEIDDQVHWFFGDDPVPNLAQWIRPDRRRMNGPASNAIRHPGDISVLPIVGVRVPFHGVRVEVAARIRVDIIWHVRERTDGLLELSASVAVPFGDCRVVDLGVDGAVEWPVGGIVRCQLERL